MKTRKAFTGIWRITDMSTWETGFIDLVAPGHIQLKSDGTGTLAFGAIQADMDCLIEKNGTTERLSFSFAGWDEGEEISGRGWAEILENKMTGWFGFNMGDDTTFKAIRKSTRNRKGTEKKRGSNQAL